MEMEIVRVIYLFPLFLGFGLANSADFPSSSVKISDGDRTFDTILDRCTLDLKGSDFPSIAGPKGDKGDMGFPGMMGSKGERGFPGSRGIPGTCMTSCLPPYDEELESKEIGAEGRIKVAKNGTIGNPSPFICNVEVNDEQFEEGLWVKPGVESFQVDCKKDTNQTCVKVDKKKYFDLDKVGINYTIESESFWLSEKEQFSLNNLYGLKPSQIEWLQKRSRGVIQKIRYHCKNSRVTYNNYNALKMYGWNDIPISYNMESSPLKYDVVEDVHFCTDGSSKTAWNYTDIVIQSGVPNRLPVTDFQIRDTRSGEDQGVFIELLELCFI